MKIIINSAEVKKFLNVAKIKDNKYCPVLSCVKIQAASGLATLTATDLENWIAGEFIAGVEGSGAFLLQAKELKDLVSAAKKENIEFDYNSDNPGRVMAQAGPNSFHVNLHSPDLDNWPELPNFGEIPADSAEFFPEDFKGDLSYQVQAVANGDPRVFLSGIHCEKNGKGNLRMVSMDGHRLHLTDTLTGWETDKAAIIPLKAVEIIGRVLDGYKKSPYTVCSLTVKPSTGELRKIVASGRGGYETAPGWAFFQAGEFYLASRLINGEFPDYNMVIPRAPGKVALIDSVRFGSALESCAKLSAERKGGVRLHLNGVCRVEVSDADRGDAAVEIEAGEGYSFNYANGQHCPEDFKAGFNARYFTEAMTGFGGTIRMEVTDELSPCVIRDAEKTARLAVVMPIRIC